MSTPAGPKPNPSPVPSPAPPAATAAPAKGLPRPRAAERPKQPWLWNVVLLDDEMHTYDYVIRMMQEVFGHDPARSLKIAKAVDTEGRAVVMTTHRELAELKLEQIHGYGRDPLLATCQGSMSAMIEPADAGTDDGSRGA